jgi:DNA repair protein RecO (recombination protein O)
MHWSDPAIILSARKFGETSAVVRVLTREHGVFSGVFRGASSKNNRGIAQAGNVVSAAWNARLAEQLGTFKLELLEAHAAHIMQDGGKLSALTSACSLLELALPERHPYPKLFSEFHEFLHILNGEGNWQEEYVKLELTLLAESGFGLDFSECAATGVTDDLVFVSPKSGRAVCRTAGEPYRDKMLPLPSFLLITPSPTFPLKRKSEQKEILAGMQLTGYFLEHSLLASHGKKMPLARARLYNLIMEQNAPETTN